MNTYMLNIKVVSLLILNIQLMMMFRKMMLTLLKPEVTLRSHP